METNVNNKERINWKRIIEFVLSSGVVWAFLSFFIPALIMLFAFKASAIHPYGNKQMLVVDLWHQYYPFFKVVREKLVTGGSFLYTWTTGMGTNFLSLISYYAMSPLNWISAFFSDEQSRDVMMYLLTAKIGFCGMSFSLFLRYTFKRSDLSLVAFSTMFALSSYMLGYYWNVMWFDTIALFPLVMMGVVAICREGKWKLFTIALALSLISNYYIGYFTCLFTILAFAAGIICEGKNIKDFFYKLWIIARSAVIGIALGGFVLLPAYYGLKLSYSANNTFPQEHEFYEKWTDIFANTLSFSPPAMKEGLPNFACGMLALVLLGVYLISPKIKIRERICTIIMLAFIAVSCNLNILNYIWHGFHFTNMIPYRFAFIFSFILIAAAYRAIDTMLTHGIKIYQLIAMPVIPAVVLYLNKLAKAEEFTAALDGDWNFIRKSAVFALVFIGIFVAGKFIPKKFNRIIAYSVSLMLCITVINEGYMNAELGVKTVGNSGYDSYPDKYNTVQDIFNYIDENDDELFYRTEMKSTYSLNDGSLYGYNGVSQFSSSANVNVTKFMKRMGLYGSEAGNRYYYRNSTPVTNAFLGIKYIISKTGKILSDPYALEEYYGIGNITASKNNFALPLGFMVSDDIKKADMVMYGNPYEYQNEIIKLATGIKENIYTPQPVSLADYGNLKVKKNKYGNYSYEKDKSNNSTSALTFSYNGVENASLYGYIGNGSGTTANVISQGMGIESNIDIKDYSITFPMGMPESNLKSEIKINPQTDKDRGTIIVMAYALDHTLWENAYAQLSDETLDITEFSDAEIKGNIKVLNDGVMYFSIPYEKGWSVYVDGKKAETFDVMSAMLGIELESGEHTIELKYIPEGFTAGVCATGGAVLLFVIFSVTDFYFRRKRRKNEALSNGNNEAQPLTMEEISADADVSGETTENTEEIAEMVNAEDAVEKTEATENTETEKEIEIKEDDNISAEQIKESDNEKS